MSKSSKLLDKRYTGKWWLRPNIDWSNIGADVTSRPVELEALNNIALEVKYIQNLNKWSLDFDIQELEILRLDYIVNRKDFEIEKYKDIKVYKQDTNIRKISKISTYSEVFVMKKLSNISRKVYLRELLDIDTDILDILKEYKEYYKPKKKIYTNKSSNKRYKVL